MITKKKSAEEKIQENEQKIKENVDKLLTNLRDKQNLLRQTINGLEKDLKRTYDEYMLYYNRYYPNGTFTIPENKDINEI